MFGSIFRVTRWLFFLSIPLLIGICYIPGDNPVTMNVRKALGLAGILIHVYLLSADSYLVHLKVWNHIEKTTKRNDPDGVIAAIDAFGWAGNMMINMGDRKSVFLDRAMAECERQLSSSSGGKGVEIAVELGSFLGYSTVRMARNLVTNGGGKTKSTLISVDPDALSRVVSLAIVDHAGLRDKVDFRQDYSYNVLHQLKKEGKQIDVLLLDHVKELYLSDLKLALELGLLHRHSYIVADNVLRPGAPELRKFVTERRDLFETTVEKSFVEYLDVEDEVTVSRCIKCPLKGEKHSWSDDYKEYTSVKNGKTEL